MVGKRFGRLIVLRRAKNTSSRSASRSAFWACRCSDGKLTVVRGSNLRNGNTKSCGCLQRESAIKIGKSKAGKGTRHGHASSGMQSPEYKAWTGIIYRCTNRDASNWKDYGGSGVKVCKQWRGEHGFENFLAYMGPRPKGRQGRRSKFSIDRWPNPKGNYEPGNCRWATWSEQNKNKRKASNGTH